MKLEKLALKKITRYHDPVEVDFAGCGPGLIAIAGVNGAGKSTLLEAAAAILFLEFPTRPGNLAGVAHDRDAQLELHFENGAPYRALVAVDAIQRATEAYLFNGDGSPITDGKVRNYTAEIERRFGSARLFNAACLSAQNKKGSFLDLGKAERKDLLAEILDTGGLQALAEAAREQGKAVEKKLENLRGQIAALEAELAAAPSVDLEALRKEEEELKAQLAQTNRDLEDARAEYHKVAQDLARAQEKETQRAAKEKNLADLRRSLIETKAQQGALVEELNRLRARIGSAQKEAQVEAARGQEYRDAAAKVQELASSRSQLEQELREAEANLHALADRRVDLKEATLAFERLGSDLKRAETDAGLLSEVPCHGEGAFAGCGFLRKAAEAKATIPKISEEMSKTQIKEGSLSTVEESLRETQALVDTKRKELQTLTGEIGILQAAAARLQLAKAAEHRTAELERELMEGESNISKRRGEYERTIRDNEAKIRDLEEDLANSPVGLAATIQKQVSIIAEKGKGLAASAEGLQKSLQIKAAVIAKAEAAVERSKEVGVLLDLHRQSAEDVARDAGEWAILERALGRDGIQALEIDAAGPELSTLTNELLTSCFGPRFEVRFQTQVPKADGKGMKEVFDVQVIDHDRGREGSVDSLSGGEKTIVSEAISLALAIYIGKHSGRRYETLFRDETAGALDPDNAARYVRMLRRAREIGSFHQIVYIAQQPEVYESADAVLWCQDGRVESKP